jgi:hypothetical protein
MEKYLIEVPHDSNKQACEIAVKTFMESGSHFMTNADFGCSDGEHKAWIIVELDNKEEAKRLVPPKYRDVTKVIKLQKFTLEDLEEKFDPHHS